MFIQTLRSCTQKKLNVYDDKIKKSKEIVVNRHIQIQISCESYKCDELFINKYN